MSRRVPWGWFEAVLLIFGMPLSALLCVALVTLAALCGSAHGAPSISGTAGTWSHGGAVTVNGSAFGTKATAAPLVWDDATGASVTDKWSGFWPDCSSDHSLDLGYKSVIRGVAMPHARATKYLAGAHGPSAGFDCGQNVDFWKQVTINTFPTTTYITYYLRNDPSWQFANVLGSLDNNHKLLQLDDGWNQPFGGQDTTNIQFLPTEGSQEPGQFSTYDGGTIGGTTRLSGANSWSFGASTWSGWVKREIEIKHSRGTDGYITVREDTTQLVSYSGRTSVTADPASMTIGIGGYSRNYPSVNNWRYFADVYYDQCNGASACPRVMLCTSSIYASRGICEPQLPTSWASGSIGVTVNAGRFANSSTAYLYVCDDAGSCNSSGTSIVIASSGGGSSAALAGAPTASVTVGGSLNTKIAVGGAPAASSTATGTLSSPSSAALSGAAAANATASGNARIRLPAPATLERRPAH